jgi:hypothetical protein
VILEDKDGKSVYRKDLQETEFNGMLQNTTDFLNIPVSFQGPKPHKWVVWASSKSKGWAEKIEGVL